MEWLARLRAPGARAQRSAGPPPAWTAAAIGVGLVLAVTAALATGGPDIPWMAVALLVPGVIPGLADRDGWHVRAAMAYVAVEQRRQWRHGRLPVTPAAANAWLAAGNNATATPLERASVLVAAGRHADAMTAIDGAEASSDIDRVRQLRLRLTVAAMSGGSSIDVAAVRAAADSLPSDQRRYQVVSAAWSQAWLDVNAGRPWRDRFAAVARAYAPYPLPRPLWLVAVALQQLVLPISIVLAFAILSLAQAILS